MRLPGERFLLLKSYLVFWVSRKMEECTRGWGLFTALPWTCCEARSAGHGLLVLLPFLPACSMHVTHLNILCILRLRAWGEGYGSSVVLFQIGIGKYWWYSSWCSQLQGEQNCYPDVTYVLKYFCLPHKALAARLHLGLTSAILASQHQLVWRSGCLILHLQALGQEGNFFSWRNLQLETSEGKDRHPF